MPPNRETPAPKPTETADVWYGWQTLLSDAAALPALVVPPLGIGTYVLGGPIVHWSHGNTGRGFASFGLRVGAPILLGLGAAAGCDNGAGSHAPGWECNIKFALGGIVGIITAVTMDAAVLARETVPVEPQGLVSLGPLKMTPTMSTTGKQTTLMLGGTF